MNIESQIRELAKSVYWQEIYKASQSCSGINLFENQNNFSKIQFNFLYWIRVYAMLYDELYSLEWQNLDEAVFNDNDRCDAFLYWRRKQQEKKIRQYKKDEKKHTPKKPNMMKVFTGADNEKTIQ